MSFTGFTIEDYPFLGQIGQGGKSGMASGTQQNVPADGSSTPTVTFSTPFSSIPIVVGDPNTTTQTNEALSVQFFNVTETSFQIYVGGGSSGSTINVGWIATNIT